MELDDFEAAEVCYNKATDFASKPQADSKPNTEQDTVLFAKLAVDRAANAWRLQQEVQR